VAVVRAAAAAEQADRRQVVAHGGVVTRCITGSPSSISSASSSSAWLSADALTRRPPAVLLRRVEKRTEVPTKGRPAAFLAEQRERGKTWKVEAILEQQDGLDASISQRRAWCIARP
jgi:hypothetical protein